ncbi:MBL fold metallo-hydrolase [candidate division GN15 bacterium]|uniref:MBL fold metallo-hydrolase n=1 Tax=candidate division GN15 bacterium TaxID=2072418 RepID=A0A855XDS2_9BACT|nr:MAG: MBL fold metallo-hydrolase [candidate division GN15 bacterium]
MTPSAWLSGSVGENDNTTTGEDFTVNTVQISKHVWWAGVKDPDLRVFDIVMPTQYGTTYNAYVVRGEKTALIDTVKKQFSAEYFAKVESLVPLDAVDYLIVNHTEPDHSGAIAELLKQSPKLQIVCSGAALPFVRNVLNDDTPLTTVKDDAVIDLGGVTLKFKIMPYMHWPDTMMEFCPEDKVLFSCDGFASHLSGESVFDEDTRVDLPREMKYYFDAIMRPFSGYIRRNMPKLDGLDIDMVAPSHGPVLRKYAAQFIQDYRDWTVDKLAGAPRVTIFYVSNYGNTGLLAEAIDKGLTEAGLKTDLVELSTCPVEKAQDLIERSAAILIGTPTFNSDAPRPVWDLMNLFSTVYSIGKKAAVFGSYGWGGEGTKLIAERLSSMKLKVYPETYRARLIPSAKEMTEVHDFARKVAEFVRE